MDIDIQYNGMKASELKVYVKELPPIPAAKREYKEITVPGRDGILLQDTGRFEPTDIMVEMNYIGPQSKWASRWRLIQTWLSKTNDELIFTDDPEYYFRILRVHLSDNERVIGRAGNFTATFITRDGLRYLRKGKLQHKIEDVIWNPGEVAFPDFYISGVGTCVITMNGNTFEVTTNQPIVIDTERRLIYKTDKTIVNNIGKGNYQDLCLLKGENQIFVSEGFDVSVIPHWRCR